MKARHRRLALLLGALALLGLGAWLVLGAFQKNLVFFYTPTQVLNGEAPAQRSFRVGGLVLPGSLRREADGLTVHFIVSDGAQQVPVSYRGSVPDLFKEGKGVVAQVQREAGQAELRASDVLAKHDENYMPPEAAYAMKKAREAGHPGTAAPAASGSRP